MTPTLPDIQRAPVRWTHEQIRAARQIELAPLLQKRGLPLREREGENFEMESQKGIFIKAVEAKGYHRLTADVIC